MRVAVLFVAVTLLLAMGVGVVIMAVTAAAHAIGWVIGQ